MSRHGEIDLVWGDGEHSFRLAIGQLRELQEKCTLPGDTMVSGPEAILGRIQSGTWRVEDVREIIRLGLIGGGMEAKNAHRMVARYVDEYEQPLLRHKLAAVTILLAALTGTTQEATPGKEGAVKAATEASKASPSPLSMEPALS
jgi:hypothetical protein